MQPSLKKLRPTLASATPWGTECCIASWNLGLPHANSNKGALKNSTKMHYATEMRRARKEQEWSMILLQEVNEHWAKVAAEILEWDYVFEDKKALCWDPDIWKLLEHNVIPLFPPEEQGVKTKKGRKVQVAPSSVALSSVAPTATTRLCATAGPGRDCV